MHRVLTINPGSTSTKVALFKEEITEWNESIDYTTDRLSGFNNYIEQLEMRRCDVERIIQDKKVDLKTLSAVVGRGGTLKPLESGTYRIDENLLKDIKSGNVQAGHISNIGALLAHEIAEGAGIPAFFVDPASVDEFEPVARVSGIPEIERKSLFHALNIKATVRKAAKDLGKPVSRLNIVVAHLGGGISVCPIQKGRIIDVNNPIEEGPFSPERAGSLPVSSLVKLCYSGKFSQTEMKRRIVGHGGLVAYLGTNNCIEVEKRMENGDKKARLTYEAMSYQIAKEIGAMATVLKGKVDAILLTGGLARSSVLVDWIRERVSFLAPIHIYAGENEMEALALGALRVLKGEEKAKTY
jgi:butyrate kinase